MVQNILHGLSPGLSDAINSISRWAFIKASFPHIIHACTAALVNRKDNSPNTNLNKTETKLLYTLHWLILDAASECEDNAAAAASKTVSKLSITSKTHPSHSSIKRQTNHSSYLHSVSTIQLFVYLFVPIIKSLKPSDLDNLKLNNGLKIWEPLWAYRQPDIPIFNTPVKQKHTQLETPEISKNVISKPESGSIKKTPEPKSFSTEPNKETQSPSKPSSNFGNIYMGNDKLEKKSGDSTSKAASILSNFKRTSQSDAETKQSKKTSRESSTVSSTENVKNVSPILAKHIEIVIKESKNDEEVSSIHVSEYDNDTIRDSLTVLNKKVMKYLNKLYDTKF